MNFLALAGGHIYGRVLDQGLANFCGQATLRHGTNPFSWLCIHLFGVKPSWGGSSIGGDYGVNFADFGLYGHDNDNNNRVYFTKDVCKDRCDFWEKHSIAKSYNIKSTINLIRAFHLPKCVQEPMIGLGWWIALIMPTIKCRFTQEEVNAMTIDQKIKPLGIACSTDQFVSPLHIGMFGTVWNGLTFKTCNRMYEHQERVITGIAQLALCGIAAYFAVSHISTFIVSYKVSMLAGLILGII